MVTRVNGAGETDPGEETVTVVDSVSEPPAPLQASVKVLLTVKAPVDSEPDVAFEPLQAPLAVQLVALVDDHVSVELPPGATGLGLALIVTVGVVLVTVTVTEASVVPPLPVQLKV